MQAPAVDPNNKAAFDAAVAYGLYQAFGLVMRVLFLGLPMIGVGIFLLTIKDRASRIIGGVLLALGVLLSVYGLGKAYMIRRNRNFAAAVGGVGMARGALGGVGGGFGVHLGGDIGNIVGGIIDLAASRD